MLVKDLLDNNIPYIKINDSFIVNKEYYDKTEILDLSKIKVEGEITYPSDENLLLDANCNGVMKIKDSVTLEPVDYSFSFKINENVYEKLENDQFSLDIIEILWENIVLEIPIRYSEVTDYKDLVGDGWKVISEDDVKASTNNPFKELLNEIEKE